jgi:hypothetical protein
MMLQTPRTISGQAMIGAMRPYLKRAIGPTILAIEAEAVAPYVDALREADRVLGDLAARDATSPWDEALRLDLVQRATAARDLVQALLEEST